MQKSREVFCINVSGAVIWIALIQLLTDGKY